MNRSPLTIAFAGAVALALLVALIAALSFELRSVAQGWLAAFVFWSGIPIGSLVLLLIHRLVGGRWGEALAPALRPAALFVPLAAIVFIPIIHRIAGNLSLGEKILRRHLPA